MLTLSITVRFAEARWPSRHRYRRILIPHQYVSTRYGWTLKPDDDLLVALVAGQIGTSMIRVAKLKCEEVGHLASTAVATLALLVVTGNFAEAAAVERNDQ